MTPSPATPRLGVVIIHFGEVEPTLRCVASVWADPSPCGRSVLVVDNSANLDGARLAAGTQLLVCPDNPGFGVGANRGVAELRDPGLGGYLVLNGDIELLPGFLDATGRAFRSGAGAASGPLYLGSPDGPLWYAGGRVNHLTGTVSQSRRPADARRAREVGFLPGTALAISRPAWDAVGGFDAAFFLYHEDVDLGLRLQRAGFRLWFEPGMRAVHHLGAATGSAERSPFYLEHLTRTRLLPYPSRAHRLWLSVLHTGWVAARAASYLLLGRSHRPRAAALLRGHRAALAAVWKGKPRPAAG